jgi:hypothetical protein
MTNNAKAIIIQIIIIVFSGILTIVLSLFFQSKGLEKLASYCMFIPMTPFGIYILFGKYVYLKGTPITKTVRIFWGLFFLLLTPIIWFIKNILLS